MNHQENKGVTLISLIVTVIVLVVLVGVTINSVIKDDNVIDKTNIATTEADKAQIKEEMERKLINLQTKKIKSPDSEITEEDIVKALGSSYWSKINSTDETETTDELHGNYKGYEVYIDEELNVRFSDEEKNINSLETAILSDIKQALYDCGLPLAYNDEDIINNKDGILDVMLQNKAGINYIFANENVLNNINTNISENVIKNLTIEQKEILRNSNIITNIINYKNISTYINTLGFKSLVPVLTKNDGNIICSSVYSGSYDSYMAFNNSDSNYWCSVNGASSNAYIGYSFNSKKKVGVATIKNGGSSSEICKNVVLQCSNDGNKWIDASEVITLPQNNNLSYIINTKVKESYSKWRIFVKTSYGTYAASREVKFYN